MRMNLIFRLIFTSEKMECIVLIFVDDNWIFSHFDAYIYIYIFKVYMLMLYLFNLSFLRVLVLSELFNHSTSGYDTGERWDGHLQISSFSHIERMQKWKKNTILFHTQSDFTVIHGMIPSSLAAAQKLNCKFSSSRESLFCFAFTDVSRNLIFMLN